MPHAPASKDRRLALRLRPDLIAVPVEMAGAATWVVKDPVTLEHFHFSAEEYALVDLLRRPVSLADLQREFAQRFPPHTITERAIWSFVGRLHREGLVISDAAGQGHELVERKRTERMRNWALAWTRLLAIRFRGVNPDRFLTAVNDRCGWLFSPGMLLVVAAVVLYAASILVGHFDEVAARLPELSALVDGRNLLCLLLTIGGIKVLHELGHALACKRFGGDVHELGLMLLAFAPCLYCDVTDAWRLPSKWQRIFVSAAGMLVELAIAALATIVWWHAQPGLLQLVALDVMLVATLSTLVVNGNPLLRYDGYYILSDLVESPNLWQRSRDVLRNWAARRLLGQRVDDDALVPTRHRAWLAVYAVASKLYLAVVLVAIVWGLVAVLHPWHLENLAYAAGLTAMCGVLVGPVMGAVRLARDPFRRRELRSGRLATLATLAVAGVVAILAMPVNYYVHAPLVLLPEEATRIYATVDGLLSHAVAAGAPVEAGATLAELKNADVELELARLDGEHRLQQLRVKHLELLRGHDAEASAQLPAARAALDDLAAQLDELRQDAERLNITTPAAGTVIAAPAVDRSSPRHGRLEQWSGGLLDPANRGALVRAGTLVGLVGEIDRPAAVLLVDDTDVGRLARGQPVRVRLDQLPGQVLVGTVADVARRDAESGNSASAADDLAPLFAGLAPPGRADVHYQAHVRLTLPEVPLTIGGRGQAKIAAERITLARWILRYLAQTFRLPA
jgi:putative peptide zinc metalloprotease protein